MCSALLCAPAVQRDSDHSKTDDESRNEHIVGLGRPSGEPDRSQDDGKHRRGAADECHHRSDGTGCKL